MRPNEATTKYLGDDMEGQLQEQQRV